MIETNSCREIKVTVPWGHISGKAWGNETNPIVLMLHGFMDNASTFNRLIPHLPDTYQYISIDLPGHGFSSHFPSSFTKISMIDFQLALKHVTVHFKRDKYILMAHSFGTQIALFFTELYPEIVDKLILIDGLSFTKWYPDEFLKNSRKAIESHFGGNKEQPLYSYEEAINIVSKGRTLMKFKPLTREAAAAIMERFVAPSQNEPGKFAFTFDQRLKHYINPIMDSFFLVQLFKSANIKCPILVILMRNTYQATRRQYQESLIEEMSKMNNVTIHFLDLDHDEHNENPTKIAPYISRFFLKINSKL